jgi:hypothetical protein
MRRLRARVAVLRRHIRRRDRDHPEGKPFHDIHERLATVDVRRPRRFYTMSATRLH